MDSSEHQHHPLGHVDPADGDWMEHGMSFLLHVVPTTPVHLQPDLSHPGTVSWVARVQSKRHALFLVPRYRESSPADAIPLQLQDSGVFTAQQTVKPGQYGLSVRDAGGDASFVAIACPLIVAFDPDAVEQVQLRAAVVEADVIGRQKASRTWRIGATIDMEPVLRHAATEKRLGLRLRGSGTAVDMPLSVAAAQLSDDLLFTSPFVPLPPGVYTAKLTVDGGRKFYTIAGEVLAVDALGIKGLEFHPRCISRHYCGLIQLKASHSKFPQDSHAVMRAFVRIADDAEQEWHLQRTADGTLHLQCQDTSAAAHSLLRIRIQVQRNTTEPLDIVLDATIALYDLSTATFAMPNAVVLVGRAQKIRLSCSVLPPRTHASPALIMPLEGKVVHVAAAIMEPPQCVAIVQEYQRRAQALSSAAIAGKLPEKLVQEALHRLLQQQNAELDAALQQTPVWIQAELPPTETPCDLPLRLSLNSGVEHHDTGITVSLTSPPMFRQCSRAVIPVDEDVDMALAGEGFRQDVSYSAVCENDQGLPPRVVPVDRTSDTQLRVQLNLAPGNWCIRMQAGDSDNPISLNHELAVTAVRPIRCVAVHPSSVPSGLPATLQLLLDATGAEHCVFVHAVSSASPRPPVMATRKANTIKCTFPNGLHPTVHAVGVSFDGVHLLCQIPITVTPTPSIVACSQPALHGAYAADISLTVEHLPAVLSTVLVRIVSPEQTPLADVPAQVHERQVTCKWPGTRAWKLTEAVHFQLSFDQGTSWGPLSPFAVPVLQTPAIHAVEPVMVSRGCPRCILTGDFRGHGSLRVVLQTPGHTITVSATLDDAGAMVLSLPDTMRVGLYQVTCSVSDDLPVLWDGAVMLVLDTAALGSVSPATAVWDPATLLTLSVHNLVAAPDSGLEATLHFAERQVTETCTCLQPGPGLLALQEALDHWSKVLTVAQQLQLEQRLSSDQVALLLQQSFAGAESRIRQALIGGIASTLQIRLSCAAPITDVQPIQVGLRLGNGTPVLGQTTVTLVPPPNILSMSPLAGPLTGGTVVNCCFAATHVHHPCLVVQGARSSVVVPLSGSPIVEDETRWQCTGTLPALPDVGDYPLLLQLNNAIPPTPVRCPSTWLSEHTTACFRAYDTVVVQFVYPRVFYEGSPSILQIRLAKRTQTGLISLSIEGCSSPVSDVALVLENVLQFTLPPQAVGKRKVTLTMNGQDAIPIGDLLWIPAPVITEASRVGDAIEVKGTGLCPSLLCIPGVRMRLVADRPTAAGDARQQRGVNATWVVLRTDNKIVKAFNTVTELRSLQTSEHMSGSDEAEASDFAAASIATAVAKRDELLATSDALSISASIMGPLSDGVQISINDGAQWSAVVHLTHKEAAAARGMSSPSLRSSSASSRSVTPCPTPISLSPAGAVAGVATTITVNVGNLPEPTTIRTLSGSAKHPAAYKSSISSCFVRLFGPGGVNATCMGGISAPHCIQFTLPTTLNAVGPYVLQLSADGQTYSSNGLVFVVHAAPVASSVEPRSLAATGGNIRIGGKNMAFWSGKTMSVAGLTFPCMPGDGFEQCAEHIQAFTQAVCPYLPVRQNLSASLPFLLAYDELCNAVCRTMQEALYSSLVVTLPNCPPRSPLPCDAMLQIPAAGVNGAIAQVKLTFKSPVVWQVCETPVLITELPNQTMRLRLMPALDAGAAITASLSSPDGRVSDVAVQLSASGDEARMMLPVIHRAGAAQLTLRRDGAVMTGAMAEGLVADKRAVPIAVWPETSVGGWVLTPTIACCSGGTVCRLQSEMLLGKTELCVELRLPSRSDPMRVLQQDVTVMDNTITFTVPKHDCTETADVWLGLPGHRTIRLEGVHLQFIQPVELSHAAQELPAISASTGGTLLLPVGRCTTQRLPIQLRLVHGTHTQVVDATVAHHGNFGAVLARLHATLPSDATWLAASDVVESLLQQHGASAQLDGGACLRCQVPSMPLSEDTGIVKLCIMTCGVPGETFTVKAYSIDAARVTPTPAAGPCRGSVITLNGLEHVHVQCKVPRLQVKLCSVLTGDTLLTHGVFRPSGGLQVVVPSTGVIDTWRVAVRPDNDETSGWQELECVFSTYDATVLSVTPTAIPTGVTCRVEFLGSGFQSNPHAIVRFAKRDGTGDHVDVHAAVMSDRIVSCQVSLSAGMYVARVLLDGANTLAPEVPVHVWASAMFHSPSPPIISCAGGELHVPFSIAEDVSGAPVCAQLLGDGLPVVAVPANIIRGAPSNRDYKLRLQLPALPADMGVAISCRLVIAFNGVHFADTGVRVVVHGPLLIGTCSEQTIASGRCPSVSLALSGRPCAGKPLVRLCSRSGQCLGNPLPGVVEKAHNAITFQWPSALDVSLPNVVTIAVSDDHGTTWSPSVACLLTGAAEMQRVRPSCVALEHAASAEVKVTVVNVAPDSRLHVKCIPCNPNGDLVDGLPLQLPIRIPEDICMDHQLASTQCRLLQAYRMNRDAHADFAALCTRYVETCLQDLHSLLCKCLARPNTFTVRLPSGLAAGAFRVSVGLPHGGQLPVNVVDRPLFSVFEPFEAVECIPSVGTEDRGTRVRATGRFAAVNQPAPAVVLEADGGDGCWFQIAKCVQAVAQHESVEFTVPPCPVGQYRVRISIAGQPQLTVPGTFQVVALPVLASIRPRVLHASASGRIVLLGSNFAAGSPCARVQIQASGGADPITLPLNVTSGTEATFDVPTAMLVPGVYRVQASMNGQAYVSCAGNTLAVVEMTSINAPRIFPTGGAALHIAGHFDGAPDMVTVRFAAHSGLCLQVSGRRSEDGRSVAVAAPKFPLVGLVHVDVAIEPGQYGPACGLQVVAVPTVELLSATPILGGNPSPLQLRLECSDELQLTTEDVVVRYRGTGPDSSAGAWSVHPALRHEGSDPRTLTLEAPHPDMAKFRAADVLLDVSVNGGAEYTPIPIPMRMILWTAVEPAVLHCGTNVPIHLRGAHFELGSEWQVRLSSVRSLRSHSVTLHGEVAPMGWGVPWEEILRTAVPLSSRSITVQSVPVVVQLSSFQGSAVIACTTTGGTCAIVLTRGVLGEHPLVLQLLDGHGGVMDGNRALHKAEELVAKHMAPAAAGGPRFHVEVEASTAVACVAESDRSLRCKLNSDLGTSTCVWSMSLSSGSITLPVSRTLTVVGAVTLKSLTPNCGILGSSTTVTLNGTGFVESSAIVVRLSAQGQQWRFAGLLESSSSISFRVPDSAIAAMFGHDIRHCTVDVSFNGGLQFVDELGIKLPVWSVFQRPKLLFVKPDNGCVVGGTPLTISGSGFESSNQIVVKFQSTTAPGTMAVAVGRFVDSGSITVMAPRFPVEGNVQLFVALNGQDYEAAHDSNPICYTYWRNFHDRRALMANVRDLAAPMRSALQAFRATMSMKRMAGGVDDGAGTVRTRRGHSDSFASSTGAGSVVGPVTDPPHPSITTRSGSIRSLSGTRSEAVLRKPAAQPAVPVAVMEDLSKSDSDPWTFETIAEGKEAPDSVQPPPVAVVTATAGGPLKSSNSKPKLRKTSSKRMREPAANPAGSSTEGDANPLARGVSLPALPSLSSKASASSLSKSLAKSRDPSPAKAQAMRRAMNAYGIPPEEQHKLTTARKK